MYHHPSRRSLTIAAAERLARRLYLMRLARERASDSVQSRDLHSRFGPLAKAARQHGAPSIPDQLTAMNGFRFPLQRTGEVDGGCDA